MKHMDETPEIGVVDAGGMQHKRPYAFDAIPPKAIIALAEIRYKAIHEYGYPEDNYKLMSIKTHVGRAMGHLTAYMDGDRSNDHLRNALARLSFAVQLEREGRSYDDIGCETADSSFNSSTFGDSDDADISTSE